MLTEDFDYDLPSELIAQTPAEPRDSCRLLVIRRATGEIEHRTFSDLPEYLRPDDILVVNETRVLPARLHGFKEGTGGAAEVLLLKERSANVWECLVKPGRRLRPGARIVFGEGAMVGIVREHLDESGQRLIEFELGPAETSFLDVVHRLGEMPLPPYITQKVSDPELYQTVFARDERSAAAPTAGLHFTPALLERIQATGVKIARVQLDVGIDTFRPVTEERAEDHHIHTEHYHVSNEAAIAVNAARAAGGRVIAVGTTSVRALESAADPATGEVMPASGATSLFILPGYRYRVVDAMVTNFHVPRSTLLMLVSAFASRDLVLDAYRVAVRERYRMLSFGDAMLIL